MKTAFSRIYLQMKNYDGTENSEETITWSPIRINEDDIEYLRPVEPSPVESSAEEILSLRVVTFFDKKAKGMNYDNFNHWLDCCAYESMETTLIEWIVEFSSQRVEREVTDEEIEKWASEKFLYDPDDESVNQIVDERRFAAIITAKAMRDGKIGSGVNLREEIEKLKARQLVIQKDWNYPNEIYIECTGVIMACDYFLEYLRSKD
jgi:hypothetical protein